MLKRPHKKTKRGSKCTACRQRHIRVRGQSTLRVRLWLTHVQCDLQRPSCVNCIRAERTCSFKSDSTLGRVDSGFGIDPGLSHQPQPAARSLSLRVGSSCALPKPMGGLGLGEDDLLVNMCHLDLFHYFGTMPTPYVGCDGAVAEAQRRLVIVTSLSTPYMMHETLAFAAKHRSIAFPLDRGDFYNEQATILQTHALRLFNKARPQPDQTNCSAMFLFSGMLGIHMLADTFTNPGLESISFVDSFVKYARTHQSLRSLAAGTWPMLMRTELAPILLWANNSTGAQSTDVEQHYLIAMLSEARDLDPEHTIACHEASKLLFWALGDECKTRQQQCVQMAFAWPLTISTQFTGLLSARRPEALVILAYYGAVLHNCRDIWVIGERGRKIVGMVAGYLDEKWMHWLSPISYLLRI